jgi:hypothetical protein
MKWLPLLTGFALLATACASQPEDTSMAQPKDESMAKSGDASMAKSGDIDCTTAQADIRVLQSEQSHALEQAMGGSTTMVPSSLVTEPEYGTSPMGAGQYSDYLNDRIQRIQDACGL